MKDGLLTAALMVPVVAVPGKSSAAIVALASALLEFLTGRPVAAPMQVWHTQTPTLEGSR